MGSRRFQLRAGRGTDLSIEVSRAFGRLVRKGRRPLSITLAAVSRDSRGRSQERRRAWRVSAS